jgi:hypothetical protein
MIWMVFMNNELLGFDDLKSRIYTLRGVKVMLDRDLAELYQVETRRINEQVKRNISRFPKEFMFQLSPQEVEDLRSQFATANLSVKSRGLPYVFTEYGVVMLASVLKSETAIDVNIKIVRAFVSLRRSIAVHPEYSLLKETVKCIESRMDTIEANHLVDQITMNKKITHLSKDMYDIRDDVRRISDILDHFQDAHVIIKRPDGGINV